MHQGNSFTPRRVRLMRLLALIFVIIGIHRTATLALPLAAPGYMMMDLTCDEEGCSIGASPLLLLTSDSRAAVASHPPAEQLFLSRLDDPQLRLKLFGLELVARLPELALNFFLAAALWQLARPRPDAAFGGVRWLGKAALAAVGLAVITPVAGAFRDVLLVTGVVPPEAIVFYVSIDQVMQNLLLAAGAWTAAWAIAAGLRARTELAEIV